MALIFSCIQLKDLHISRMSIFQEPQIGESIYTFSIVYLSLCQTSPFNLDISWNILESGKEDVDWMKRFLTASYGTPSYTKDFSNRQHRFMSLPRRSSRFYDAIHHYTFLHILNYDSENHLQLQH